MKIGTKSVLFGAHCFFLHPFFVAYAWWKLYGFRSVESVRDTGQYSLKDPWLWVAFLVHDLGYWGKPNMDGQEGEQHPWFGARFMYGLQGAWLFFRRYAWAPMMFTRRWELGRRWRFAHIHVATQRVIWGNECLYHSRFLSSRYGVRFSKLCVADKMAIAVTPWWLYVPMTHLTREIHEYSSQEKHRADMAQTQDVQDWGAHSFAAHRAWFLKLQDHMRQLIASDQLEVKNEAAAVGREVLAPGR